jgi:hypothetical protein
VCYFIGGDRGDEAFGEGVSLKVGYSRICHWVHRIMLVYSAPARGVGVKFLLCPYPEEESTRGYPQGMTLLREPFPALSPYPEEESTRGYPQGMTLLREPFPAFYFNTFINKMLLTIAW